MTRVAFGVARRSPSSRSGLERVANCRIMIRASSGLLVLDAARQDGRSPRQQGGRPSRDRDDQGRRAAEMLNFVVDWAIQAHGAAGMSNRSSASGMSPRARDLVRLVDGPDEVHRNQIGKMEFEKYAPKTREKEVVVHVAGIEAVARKAPRGTPSGGGHGGRERHPAEASALSSSPPLPAAPASSRSTAHPKKSKRPRPRFARRGGTAVAAIAKDVSSERDDRGRHGHRRPVSSAASTSATRTPG